MEETQTKRTIEVEPNKTVWVLDNDTVTYEILLKTGEKKYVEASNVEISGDGSVITFWRNTCNPLIIAHFVDFVYAELITFKDELHPLR